MEATIAMAEAQTAEKALTEKSMVILADCLERIYYFLFPVRSNNQLEGHWQHAAIDKEEVSG